MTCLCPARYSTPIPSSSPSFLHASSVLHASPEKNNVEGAQPMHHGFGRPPSMHHHASSSTRHSSLSNRPRRFLPGGEKELERRRRMWSPVALSLLSLVDDEVAGKYIWSRIGTHTMATILSMRHTMVDMMGADIKDMMLAGISKHPFCPPQKYESPFAWDRLNHRKQRQQEKQVLKHLSMKNKQEYEEEEQEALNPIVMDMGMLFTKMGGRLTSEEERVYVMNMIRLAAEAGIQFFVSMEQCGMCCKFKSSAGETFSPYCTTHFSECHTYMPALAKLACDVKMKMAIRRMQGLSDKELQIRYLINQMGVALFVFCPGLYFCLVTLIFTILLLCCLTCNHAGP